MLTHLCSQTTKEKLFRELQPDSFPTGLEAALVWSLSSFRAFLAVSSSANLIYGLLGMNGLYSVYSRIPIARNARTRTTSLDGSFVLRDPLNGTMSNQSLQLTLYRKGLTLTNVNCASPAETCADLWWRLALEIHLNSFTGAQNCKSNSQLQLFSIE